MKTVSDTKASKKKISAKKAPNTAEDKQPSSNKETSDTVGDSQPSAKKKSSDTAKGKQPPAKKKSSDTAKGKQPLAKKKSSDTAGDSQAPVKKKSSDTAGDSQAPVKKKTATALESEQASSKDKAELVAVVIDDDASNRDFFARLIEQAQYTSLTASTGKEAIEIVDALPSPPTVIVIDSELPDTKGIELIKHFHKQVPTAKLIMATMLDDRSLIREAFAQGCDAFLVKPHGYMELYKRLQILPIEPTSVNNLVFDKYGIRSFKK